MSTYKNLARSGNEYARVLPGTDGGFRGVDLASAPNRVATYRLADCKNMYRDYRSAEGGALETIPGFRCIKAFGGMINGVHHWRDAAGLDHLMVHAETALYITDENNRENTEAWVKVSGTVANAPSKAFCYNGFFYILDGTTYQRLTLDDEGKAVLMPVSDLAYVPTVFVEGDEYEQRNMANDKILATGSKKSEVPPARKVSDYVYNGEKTKYIGKDGFAVSPFGYPSYYCNTNAEFVVFRGSDLYANSVYGERCYEIDEHIRAVAFIADVNAAIAADACGCYKALSSIYLSVMDDSKIRFWGGRLVAGEECRVFYNFPASAFADICNYPEIDQNENVWNALYYLPPNVVLRPGETVVLEKEFIFRSADDTYVSANIQMVDAYAEVEVEDNKIAISSVDGRITVKAGKNVITGRSCFCGAVYSHLSKTGEAEHLILRIEVVAEGDPLPHAAVDVFEYDATLKKIYLSTPATELVSVTDGTYEIAYGCYRNREGEIEAIGVMEPSEAEVKVTQIATTYHFSTAADAKVTSMAAIDGCTLCTVFDNRVFLTGHPALPNTVFYSMADDPTYFGVLNYFNEGGGFERITALLPFSDTLAVCKADKIYYRTGADGEDNLLPRVYVGKQGSLGLGCLGACCNFLDDPVFLTKEGLWGLNKADVTLERALGRRSGNVDPRLLGEADLARAEMVEWEGWLCLFINGNIYMADSRAVFTDATGNVQYEWFLLSDVGVWKENGIRFSYYEALTGDVTYGSGPEGVVLNSGYYKVNGLTVVRADEDGIYSSDNVHSGGIEISPAENVSVFYVEKDGEAILVVPAEEYERVGEFVPALHPLVVEDRLYFGNADGELYVFNNDKRGVAVGDEAVERDEIHRSFYSFDGHRIEAGFVTRQDDCDVPHLTKSTFHRSLTVRAKLMDNGAFSMAVCTEKEPTYREIVTATPHNFYAADFGNTSYHTARSAVIVGREQEKRWVEKQYLFRDGGFQRPFGIYSVAYRYRIAGRIRE